MGFARPLLVPCLLLLALASTADAAVVQVRYAITSATTPTLGSGSFLPTGLGNIDTIDPSSVVTLTYGSGGAFVGGFDFRMQYTETLTHWYSGTLIQQVTAFLDIEIPSPVPGTFAGGTFSGSLGSTGSLDVLVNQGISWDDPDPKTYFWQRRSGVFQLLNLRLATLGSQLSGTLSGFVTGWSWYKDGSFCSGPGDCARSGPAEITFMGQEIQRTVVPEPGPTPLLATAAAALGLALGLRGWRPRRRRSGWRRRLR